MAEPLLTLLGQLKRSIEALKMRNAELERRNAELEELNATLKSRAEEAFEARRRTELDVKYLQVSHKLADNPDSLVMTRRHIAQLIRNIDRCLEMLKE